MARRPIRTRRPVRNPYLDETPQGWLSLAWDLVRGYFYFTRQASCYVLVVALAILIPMCALCTAIYLLFLQTR